MPGDYERVSPHSRGFPLLRRHKTSFPEVSILKDNRASLVVAPSVVSIRVYSGEGGVCFGSGFVLESNQQFEAAILTSGALFKGDDLQVVVFLPNRKMFLGEVEVCDFHFNLALVKVRADELLKPVKLGHIKENVCFRAPCDRAELFLPGSRLIALGRNQVYIEDFMVASGEFSVEDCQLDCKELLNSTCKIEKSGIGGPMINQEAQVVGVNFFANDSTPFLPINIVMRWLQLFRKYGECRRPWMGMRVSNLYTMTSCTLEKVFQKFPSLRSGVVVDEVTPNSPAGYAGIVSQDIILACDGDAIEGCLQMFDMISDKVGKPTNLLIAKLDGSQQILSVVIADVDPSQFYGWPLQAPHGDLLKDRTSWPLLSEVLKLEGKRVTNKRKGIHRLLKYQSKKRRCIHMNLFKRLTFL
ncbi:hypothetical protein OROHE_020540 [Orobanche hederae]